MGGRHRAAMRQPDEIGRRRRTRRPACVPRRRPPRQDAGKTERDKRPYDAELQRKRNGCRLEELEGGTAGLSTEDSKESELFEEFR